MKTINDIYEGILSDIDIAMGEDDINMKKVTILDKLNSYLAKPFSPQQAEKFIEFDFDEDIPVLNINCSVYYNHSQKLDGLTDGSFRFGTIKGHFVISDTDFVTSLKYGPKAIVGKRSDGEPHDFDINGMSRLKTLEGCPRYVSGDMYIHHTGLPFIDYLPKDIYGNLHIANNSFLRGSDVPKKGDTCNIAGYVATHRNYYPFSEKNFKKCKIKFNKGNLFEGILDDIDVAIEKSDAAVKERDRADKLAKMNIPKLSNLCRGRGGMYFCWEMPDSILKMIKPYIADCINTMEKDAGSWFREYIIKEACRIKVHCTGKVLKLKLVRRDSADGTVFFRLQGNDYSTFGKSHRDIFELMVKLVEQMALHPDILVEMVKNPSTRTKDTKKLYDKLMGAE